MLTAAAVSTRLLGLGRCHAWKQSPILFATNHRSHGDTNLEIEALRAEFAHRYEAKFQCRQDASEVDDGAGLVKSAHLI